MIIVCGELTELCVRKDLMYYIYLFDKILKSILKVQSKPSDDTARADENSD